jgi:hypothetical protein
MGVTSITAPSASAASDFTQPIVTQVTSSAENTLLTTWQSNVSVNGLKIGP